MRDPETTQTAVLLIHYGELALKGRNRGRFEDRLIANLRDLLGGAVTGRPMRPRGRLIWNLAAGVAREEVIERVSRIYGIANFAFAAEHPLELDAFTAAAVALAQDRKPGSFSVRARRADKRFPMRSPEINRHVGAAVQEATGCRVQLDAPELEIRIDLLPDRALVYHHPHPGAGGLPVGIEGKVTVMLSAGSDSPVAAAQMMVRSTCSGAASDITV